MTMNAGSGRRAAVPTIALRAAAPYAWPYDGAVRVDHLGVLVVAAQGGFAERCAATAETVAAIAAIERVADAAARAGVPIVRTRHSTPVAQRRPGSLPRPGRPGYALLPGAADTVIDAPGFDAFFATPLAEALAARRITHLLVCGLWLEGPVHSTLRGANDRGLECVLLTDACAPADPALGESAISSIEMSGGIFGAVASSATAVAALNTTNLEES